MKTHSTWWAAATTRTTPTRENPPGHSALCRRLIHPEDFGRVRVRSAVSGEALLPRLQCDACHRSLSQDEVRIATHEEADRWSPAPVIASVLSTGQYL